MVVFPELCASDINKEVKEQAEKIPGELTEFFSHFAKRHELWLIPEVCMSNQGKIYNTTTIFRRKANWLVSTERDTPWCPYEKTDPGKDPFVFHIEGVGAVGVMICYDLWFPEVARDLVNLGAELILVPTMTTTGDRSQEQVISRATSIMQQCYVLAME